MSEKTCGDLNGRAAHLYCYYYSFKFLFFSLLCSLLKWWRKTQHLTGREWKYHETNRCVFWTFRMQQISFIGCVLTYQHEWIFLCFHKHTSQVFFLSFSLCYSWNTHQFFFHWTFKMSSVYAICVVITGDENISVIYCYSSREKK